MDIQKVNDPEDAIRGDDDEPHDAYVLWVITTLALCCGFAFGLLVAKVGVWL
jgi:hypothetical protein